MCEALLNEGSNSSELHLLQKTNDMSETICFCWGQTTFTHPKTREIAVFFWLVVSGDYHDLWGSRFQEGSRNILFHWVW